MSDQIFISASLLGANPLRLGAAIEQAELGGASAIHIDMMDGQFVSKIAQGTEVVAAVRSETDLLVDVHLQVARPELVIERCAEAGADIVTVHVESTPHPHRCVQLIHALGRRAGVAINPGTPAMAVTELLDDADYVWVMTHNPATAGYIPRMEDKVRAVERLVAERGTTVTIAVDGGVSPRNIKALRTAGARWFVSGSEIFSGRNGDVSATIAQMKEAARTDHRPQAVGAHRA